MVKISFADLTYTKQGIASLMFPLGISYVAASAKKNFQIDAEVFKYPDDFSIYLEKETPRIACFSSYAWNTNLAYNFAERIKKRNPKTIIAFGGPNYPIHDEKRFLIEYPAIDFFIQREGEQGFAELFKALEKSDFSAEKSKQEEIKGSSFISGKRLVKGELLPRLKNLDDIPSPYLTGLNDKFFDGILIPMLQTTRGCPFTCAYCQDGNSYFNEIARFSPERIKQEFEYVAERVKVPNLVIVDDNFGMYKEDIETAKIIAELRRKYGWPKYIDVATGKNNPKRVLECATILKGNMNLGASVQSTDKKVLKNIRRSNISLEDMIELAKEGEKLGVNSLGEVILGLPGDSKKAHFKSIADMVDVGVNHIRSYQLVLLYGSELADREKRKEFEMQTKFRVMALCFGNYSVYGEKFTSAEIDEICVSNKTLSYKDYLECRALNLTMEIAYNSGVFRELINFLNTRKISASQFLMNAHQTLRKKFKDVYEEFLEENEECLWEKKEELERFLKLPETRAKGDSSCGLVANQLYKYRAIVFFEKMRELHDAVFDYANKMTGDSDYLRELYQFSLARKENLLQDRKMIKQFHFDFTKLAMAGFNKEPYEFYLPQGMTFEIQHSPEQRDMIAKNIEQYGNSADGLGRILHKNFVNTFYRQAKII